MTKTSFSNLTRGSTFGHFLLKGKNIYGKREVSNERGRGFVLFLIYLNLYIPVDNSVLSLYNFSILDKNVQMWIHGLS